MLDPKEMKKGGFGAFAELDRERRKEREKASENGTAPATVPAPEAVPAPGTDISSTPSSSSADGTP
jgi:hypothetical protein